MPVTRGGRIDPAATQAKVLAAAAELFYQRGVDAVGVDEVAERANASKLSLYRYFHSKEGLIEAVFAQRSDRIHQWLVDSTAAATPGRGQVLAIFDILLTWYREENYRGCAVVNAAIETRGRQSQVGAVARRHLARYRDLLEQRLSSAGMADPAPLARQLLLLIEGATVVAAMEGQDTAGRDARKAAEALLDAAGIGVTSGDGTPPASGGEAADGPLLSAAGSSA